MNLLFFFYQTSYAQIFWCRQWLVESDHRLFSRTFTCEIDDILIRLTFLERNRSNLFRSLRRMMYPSFVAAMFALGFNLHYYARKNKKSSVQLLWLATLLLGANVLQRSASGIVMVANDLYLIVKRQFEQRPAERIRSLFGEQTVFIQQSVLSTNRQLYDKSSQYLSTLALFSIAWTFTCAEERASAILLLLIYEVVPLLYLSSISQQLLSERIVSVCFQTLVFAKVNCWILPANSPMWFPAMIIHVLAPVAVGVGDSTCRFF